MKENRSVKRLLDILELVSQHEEGLTLGQIYRMLGIPKATAYDFLQTLYKEDAVYYKDPRLKNYVIGSKMFAIGSVYTKNSNLIEAAEYGLKKYSDEYGKTSFISKKTKDQIVLVYKYQPSNSLIATPEELGTVLQEENNPITKVFKIFNEKKYSDLTPEEKEIYDKGYVLSDENQGRISIIAVPIRNFENKVTGVLSVSDLYTEPEEQETIDSFVELGRVVSRRLGYLGD